MLKQLNIDTLDALFSFLGQQHDIIFWIRNPDYSQQLYVSKTYETICKRSTGSLYANPQEFNDFLVDGDRERAPTLEKVKDPDFDGRSLFRLITPDNALSCFQQTVFSLLGKNQEHLGFMGLAKQLPEHRWHQELFQWEAGEEQPLEDPQKEAVLTLLQSELQMQVVPFGQTSPSAAQTTVLQTQVAKEPALMHQGQPTPLTPREQQCLKALMRGLSAKQTAAQLCISPRTVEYHLGNIKDKAQCRTQLELLSKVIHHDS